MLDYIRFSDVLVTAIKAVFCCIYSDRVDFRFPLFKIFFLSLLSVLYMYMKLLSVTQTLQQRSPSFLTCHKSKCQIE